MDDNKYYQLHPLVINQIETLYLSPIKQSHLYWRGGCRHGCWNSRDGRNIMSLVIFLSSLQQWWMSDSFLKQNYKLSGRYQNAKWPKHDKMQREKNKLGGRPAELVDFSADKDARKEKQAWVPALTGLVDFLVDLYAHLLCDLCIVFFSCVSKGLFDGFLSRSPFPPIFKLNNLSAPPSPCPSWRE